jgi:type II secretory pathway predicted ATPase ExeA
VVGTILDVTPAAASIGPDFAAEAFSLTPDPGRLFLSHDHAEALAKLRRGIESRRGLVVLVAEVGLGKTTLTYSLLTALGSEVRTAYVANPRLDFEGLLRMALADFGVPTEARTRTDLLRAVDELTAACTACGQTAVLVIDEAQGLDRATFESLLLLSRLQLVLVGQPELDEKLRTPELRAVADRVAVHIEIEPLGPAESREYVWHRLTKAGGSPDAFNPEALDVILRRAEGVPRRLNILCHNALLVAYASGADVVTPRMAEQAIEELTGGTLVRLTSRPLTVLEKYGPSAYLGPRARIGAAVLGAVGVFAIVWQMRRPVTVPPAPPRAIVVDVQPAPECSQPVVVAIADPETRPSVPVVVPDPSAAPPPTIVVTAPAVRPTSSTLPRAEPPAEPPVEVAIAIPPPSPSREEPVAPSAPERLPPEVPIGREVTPARAEAPPPQEEARVAALAPTLVPPPAAPPSGLTDAEVRAFIDRYARAWHAGDVGELRRIGQVSDDAQAKALGKYFESVREFDVQVRILEMEGSGDRRTVRFTRRDTFRDPTGREVSKESPPIEKTIVRTPQGLRFAPRS